MALVSARIVLYPGRINTQRQLQFFISMKSASRDNANYDSIFSFFSRKRPIFGRAWTWGYVCMFRHLNFWLEKCILLSSFTPLGEANHQQATTRQICKFEPFRGYWKIFFENNIFVAIEPHWVIVWYFRSIRKRSYMVGTFCPSSLVRGIIQRKRFTLGKRSIVMWELLAMSIMGRRR